MHLLNMIFHWAKTDPHRIAIVQPEMVTTYEGLADAILSIGNRIDQLGLDPNETVAVSIANPVYLIATVFAALNRSYSVAIVNPARYPLLKSAGIRNLLYDTQGQVLSGGRNIRFDLSWVTKTEAKSHRKDNKPHAEMGDLIFFTSGSTGLPKKVVQTTSALDQLLKYPFTCASGLHERILIVPSLTSTFGFNRVCEILNVGKTVCFAPDGISILWLIGLFAVDLIVTSAAQALDLATLKQKNPGVRVDTLKAVLVAGGRTDQNGLDKIRRWLCRNVISQYGSTEAGVIAVASFNSLTNPGAIGCVLPWVELEIVNEMGQPLPYGQEGLVRLRTPQLMENLKVATQDGVPGVRDDWYYPGDVGSLTDQGMLCLAGRSSDVLNRGGVKVSANLIVEVLKDVSEITDAAVCSVMGQSGLDEIWVAVETDAAVDTENLKTLIKAHPDVGIAPDELFVLKELPRGELGKVQQYRLKEILLNLKKAG